MEQQSTKQHDFKGFHYRIGAHEVTKVVVPLAAVIAQDAEVRAGMEQQENAQEGTKQCHKDFLADGVNFWEVHTEDNLSAKVLIFSADWTIDKRNAYLCGINLKYTTNLIA